MYKSFGMAKVLRSKHRESWVSSRGRHSSSLYRLATLALTVSSVVLMPPIGDPRKIMWLGLEGEGGQN